MSYIGNSSTQQTYIAAVDYFSGNASTTAFTLSRTVAAVSQMIVVIENVPQNPSTAFTVSGNTITFTSAPPSGSNNIWVQYTSPVTQVIAPSPGTVTPGTLSVPNALYWTTSGYVGIGVTTPACNLEVYNSTTSQTKIFQVGNQGSGVDAYGDLFEVWNDSSPQANTTKIKTRNNLYVYAGTNGLSGTASFCFSGSGYFGIGTNTPTTQLQVYGAGSGTFGAYNDPLIIQGTTYSFMQIKGVNGIAATILNTNGTNGWFIGTNNSGAYHIAPMASMDQTGVTNAKDTGNGFSMDSNSRVGIGTTTYTAKLRVEDGTVDLYGGYNGGSQKFAVANNGQIYSTSGSISVISDKRKKENIRDLDTGLLEILKLQPRRFDWKEESGIDKKNVAGFIAQEVQVIFPDMIDSRVMNDNDDTEYFSVRTSDLIPTLVKAIQELKSEIDALKAGK